MPFNHKLGYFSIAAFTIALVLYAQISFANCDEKPCTNLLGLMNRPTISDSPCTVANKKVLLEYGYQYFDLIGGGSAQEFPFAQLRIGLPYDTEIVYVPPVYVTQTVRPKTGWTATAAAVKHMVAYTDKMVFSIEGYFIPPSGSRDFGMADFSTILLALYSYSLTEKIGFTLQLGVSSLTTPSSQGGERYNSFNPDIVLAWQPTEVIQFYGELYGQTNTGPGQGAGYDAGIGLQYLLNKNTEFDISFNQRITGELGGFNNFIAVGMGILFS